MSLTVPQLKAMSFGYLTGADLLQFAAAQLLIKQYEVDPTSLQNGCKLAYSEMIGQLSTRYNIATELAKTGTIGALATAAVAGGLITAITVTARGLGYTTAPTVVITGGGGTGGAATAILLNGLVTSITITAAGTGYTSAPIIELSGGVPTDTRVDLCVQICTWRAIKNILANLQNLSDEMKTAFKEAKKDLLDIRNGQLNLPIETSGTATISEATLVANSFKTLG